MPRSRLLPLGLASGVALTLAACQDNSNPTGPDPVPPSARVQASQGADLPPASEFARQVPGFGGFFLDRSGTPTLYLTRGSSRAPAERLLAGYLSRRGLTPAAVRVLEGRYGWGQLERWQAQASTEALALPGAVFVDNDETSNRVRIGVEHLSAMAQVRAAAARLRIPDEAVIVERAEPIVQVATL